MELLEKGRCHVNSGYTDEDKDCVPGLMGNEKDDDRGLPHRNILKLCILLTGWAS